MFVCYISGVKALAGVVQVSPHYAVENQDVVLECLDDADHTIRRQVGEKMKIENKWKCFSGNQKTSHEI